MDSEPRTQVFNRAALLQSLEGNNDIARKLIRVFLDDVPEKIESLRDYMKAGNAERISFYAHRIHGACSYVYGDALRKVAAKIENLAHEGDLKSAEAMLTELQNQYDILEVRLTKFINDNG